MNAPRLTLATFVSLCMVMLFALGGAAFATLPDNRVFEMVSPVEKGGHSIMPNLALSDANGEHVIVDGGLAHSLLPEGPSWMLETRTPTGWSGVQVGPPSGNEAGLVAQAYTYIGAVSDDFSRFLFQTSMSFDPRDPVEENGDMYVRNGSTGPFAWVSGPPAPEVKVLGSHEHGIENTPALTAVFSGASADLSHVVWNQFYPLVPPPGQLPGSPPDTHTAGDEVYESVEGAAQLAGLVPATGTECSPSHGSCVVPPCGAAMGNEGHTTFPLFREFAFATVKGAVSRDGSRVIFTSPDPRVEREEITGCGSPEVYVRVNGTSTVQVSASQRTGGDPSGPQPKLYVGSAEEGGQLTTVYFDSKEELTDESNTGVADEGNDLYAYSLATRKLTDLTPDGRVQDLTGAGVITFVGAAADGSRVYFTAHGVLAGANAQGRVPAEDESANNLYVYEAASGLTTFVAPGAAVEGPPVARGAKSNNTQVTPDGRNIVFLSSEDLTGYNNIGACGAPVHEVRQQAPCSEVYLYDAASERLVCVSCNPTGVPPRDSATLPQRFKDGGTTVGEQTGALPSPRFVTDDGSRVFFNSPDQLTAEAVPPPEDEIRIETLVAGNAFVPNAYEWENGQIHLLAASAAIVEATPSGNDVFIDTFAQLTPQDTDGSPDIYDARVDGGFPAIAPPACSGTSCQGIPAASPIFATPSSATFSGPGNFPPEPPSSTTVKPKPKPKPKLCNRGHMRKRDRCVRKHQAKKVGHGKGRK